MSVHKDEIAETSHMFAQINEKLTEFDKKLVKNVCEVKALRQEYTQFKQLFIQELRWLSSMNMDCEEYTLYYCRAIERMIEPIEVIFYQLVIELPF